MKVNFWYSNDMEEWRWTLTSDEDVTLQESGNREKLRDAMNDVANTVEYMLECESDTIASVTQNV